jgi:hypothetical protein
MAYTITLTDGTIFATVADGTINTSSSMTLVGKNYAGYGQFLDTNYIRLLENGSNTTAPGAPLTGQLWWDKSTNTMKVYTGTTFKTISSATASSSAPTNNVVGDLWWDTTNQQLNAWNGSNFVLVGPASGGNAGVTGAIAITTDNGAGSPRFITGLYSANVLVATVSQYSTPFSPSTPPAGAGAGFATISPGMQLTSTPGSNVAFVGTATGSDSLGGFAAAQYLRLTSSNEQITSGNVAIGSGSAPGAVLKVFNIQNLGANATGNIGSSSSFFNRIFATSSSALYADVAERFAADEIMAPGTVVELGGSQEITKSRTELSDAVFGVVSTRAAYLMNAGAGEDDTHPPVAMTGRVPVMVIGTVHKGDRLVSAGDGIARAARPGEATAFNTIGRALTHKEDSGRGTVEAIVTIK